jgi:hypothetical protein
MKSIIVCFILLVASSLFAAQPDRVAILLGKSTEQALAGPLRTYIADVEARFPVKLQVVARNWKSPEQVRAAIKELHAAQRINGVILVGAMPMHRFHMHGFANPNPLYYEDFDLKFNDQNNDGFADTYEGKPNLKVWVANLRSSVKANDDGIDNLRKFFAKTHAFYHSNEVFENRALAVSASDWPTGGTYFRDQVATKLFKDESIEVLEGKMDCIMKSVKQALQARPYSLFYIQVHSDWNGQQLEDASLVPKQIANLETGALITINHGCSTANWMKNNEEKTSPNMAMSYVFGKGIGQAVVAQVRVGMVYQQDVLYKGLIAGDYLGKAYFETKKEAELQFSEGDHNPGDIVSGILMIGNPFLRIPPP